MKLKSPRGAVRRIAAAALLICVVAAIAQSAQAVSIIASPTNLSMFALSGSTSDVQAIDVTSSGAPFSFNIAIIISSPSQVNWLTIDKRFATTPATLTVTANPLGLGLTSPQNGPSQPLYQASILIIAAGTTNTPLTIPVTFNVTGLRQLAVDTPRITFSAPAGSTPATQAVGVTSVGSAGGELVYAASATSGGNWLSVSPSSSLTPRVMNVGFDISALAPGNTYEGTILVNDTANSTSTLVIIPVAINITAAASISLAPTSLSFSGPPGTSPPAQTFQISNGSSGALSWTAAASTTSGGNWLSVNPASGSTPSTATVTVNLAALGAGNYNGKITVSSPGIGNSPQVLDVTLAVGSQPAISLSPGALFFSTTPGNNPPPQNLQVGNSGVGVLGWSAATSTTSGGNWLEVGPTSGTAPSTLTTTVSSASLAQGNYNGKVTLSSANALNSPQVVSTLLTVSSNAPIANQNGVVNGGSFSTDTIVAPNTIASLFGGRMSNDLFSAQTLPLPQILGTTQVYVNGVAAPLFFVSNTQINFQMPPEVTGSSAVVNVVFNGATSAPITVNLAPAAPGIFTRNQQGTGAGAVLNGDFSPNSAANPAPRGSTVLLFATGLGPTDPPVAAGQPGAVAEPFNRLVSLPQVTIGGLDAHVDFAAVAPGFVGEYQVNVVVPQNVAPGGAVNVQITAAGKSSNTATIAVN